MFKKSSRIFLGIFVLVGIALASGTLFPDTPGLPRLPSGPGTIGGFFDQAFFGLDGTAKNTEMLVGATASGYLQNRDCASEWLNKVWVGVDILGRARCGYRITPLAMIGRFTYIDGNVQVLKVGSAIPTPANLTDPLMSGDLVMTNAGSGTITFDDDLSILRLDVDTMVDLRTGTDLGGNSIAEAILRDGSLWGRILSNTGINLGGGGMIAGVGGTSLGIQKIGNDFVFSLTDSKGPMVATFDNYAVGSVPSLQISGSSPIAFDHDGDGDADADDLMLAPNAMTTHVVGRKIIHPNNSLLVEPGVTIGKVNLLTNPWVRENIKKDVVYLDYIVNSGGLDTSTQLKIEQEVMVAVPKNSAECSNTLMGNIIERSKHTIPGFSILSNTTCAVWSGVMNDLDKKNSIICAIQGRNYWLGLTGAAKCQETGLLAFADYTTGDNRMYYSSGSIIPPTYEKYLGNNILDDGWFAGAKCDPGVVFGFHTPAWSNPNIIGPGYPDVGKTIYITNPSVPIACTQLPGKDKFKYDAVWDRTPPATLPYGTITGSGITFSAGKYTAYPRSLLTGGLPTAINGATIVVRVNAAELISPVVLSDKYLISFHASSPYRGVWLHNGGTYNKLEFGNPSGSMSYFKIIPPCSSNLASLGGAKVDISFSAIKQEILDINGNTVGGCSVSTLIDLFGGSSHQLLMGQRDTFSTSTSWPGSIYGITIKN